MFNVGFEFGFGDVIWLIKLYVWFYRLKYVFYIDFVKFLF